MRRAVTFGVGFALQLAAMAISGEAYAAPETFNTALPVGKGDFVFREQLLYRKASDDPSPADRDLEVLGGISVLGYGATSDLGCLGAARRALNRRLPRAGSGSSRESRSSL